MLRILIVEDVSKPYWENKYWRFGDVDPVQWGCLLFKEFNIKTYFEYKDQIDDPSKYEDYYLSRLEALERTFPMVYRLKDYYKDAFFSRNELKVLIDELKSLQASVIHEDARKLLNQLFDASQLALEENATCIDC